jgi:hypothetical protein
LIYNYFKIKNVLHYTITLFFVFLGMRGKGKRGGILGYWTPNPKNEKYCTFL